MYSKRSLYFLLFTLAVLNSLFSEVDARRKVLQGRKVMSREYYSEPALPVWVKIVLIGIGILFGGAILYGVLYKLLVK